MDNLGKQIKDFERAFRELGEKQPTLAREQPKTACLVAALLVVATRLEAVDDRLNAWLNR